MMQSIDILDHFYLYIDGRAFELPAVWRVTYEEYTDEGGRAALEVVSAELLSWGDRYSRSRDDAIAVTDCGLEEVQRQEEITANSFDPDIWL